MNQQNLTVSHLEERVEFFMDKLCMLQLMSSLENVDRDTGTGNGRANESQSMTLSRQNKDDRDWSQLFCEDVVEPLCVFAFAVVSATSQT